MFTKVQSRFTAMKESKKAGFTLIELVVVIAIMAVLALIMVPNLTAYLGKAETSKIQANLKNIHTSAEMVYQTATDKDITATLNLAEIKTFSNQEVVKVAADKAYSVSIVGDKVVVQYGAGASAITFDGVVYVPTK